MKTKYHQLLVMALMSVSLNSFAQAFSSGSDGSYGPMNITSNTVLDLPPNGIYHCTTINIAPNVTLSFRRNPLNTPVYLLATSNVTINGIIDVSGKNGSSNPPIGGDGGPGGFDGGKPGSTGIAPGAGYGPGAGKGGLNTTGTGGAGYASYGSSGGGGSTTNGGSIYGSPLLIPLIGGSGGGGTSGSPGVGGSGGGGAVLVSSSTRIDFNNGIIRANCNGVYPGSYNGGSGGAIRLVSPVVAGSGQLFALGNAGGGHGRIRVDTLNRTAMNLSFNTTDQTSIGSMMVVFPTVVPRLDILNAAGTAIPEGNASPVIINLPFGSSPNRTIVVQARDFNAIVPIAVVLTPDSGLPVTYSAQIDNRTTNPAQVTVDVVLPLNVQVTVNAWTK